MCPDSGRAHSVIESGRFLTFSNLSANSRIVPSVTITGRDIIERRESEVRSYCRTVDAVFSTAHGSVVRDQAGREYIDFLAGAGALNYGHNHPVLKQALLDYIQRDGVAHGLDLVTEAKTAFLAAFEARILTPRRMHHRVQFTGPTGTDAVEAALKLARKVTGRTNVIAFTNAFHGMTQASLSATGNRHHRIGPTLALSGITRMPYDGYLGDGIDTSELLERLLHDPSSGVDPPAAVLLETVQGEGGLNVASPQWLQRVARIAADVGALLIVDDVQAGCGRTGRFFSTDQLAVAPDLIVLSKSLSGFGLPLSVVLVEPKWDQWLPGESNGTFRGNAHAFVTAAAALDHFWRDAGLTGDIERRGALIDDALREIAGLIPGARVKGRGMMLGLDMGSARRSNAVRRHCIDNGVLIECCGPHDEVVKVMAPLTTPDDLLVKGLAVVKQAALDAADTEP